MGVDSNASSLAPNPITEHQKPISVEHKPTLKERISKIFNKDQPPKQTLTELAAIDPNESAVTNTSSETNIDNSSKNPEEPITVDPQPETPPVDTAALKKEDAQQTAKDIEEITQTIQQESTPKVEEISPIPNIPNLRKIKQQQDQQKQQELQKHPLKSRIEKAKSKSEEKKVVDQLKKKGVPDAENYYKKLSEIGVSKSQIIAKTPEFINLDLNPEQAATVIERITQLDYPNSGVLSPYIPNDPSVATEIAKISQEDFNQRLAEAQKYQFLNIVSGDVDSVVSFLKGGLDQTEKSFLDQINELAKVDSNDRESKTSLTTISYDSLFTIKNEGKLEEKLQLAQRINDRITNFFDTKESGSVLKEQQTRLTKLCVFDSQSEEGYLFWVKDLINGNYSDEFIKNIILTNEPLTSDYFLKYFRKANVVPLPDKIIQTFTPEEQRLWKSLSKINSPSNRLISFLDFRKTDINQYFDENCRPTEKLINDLLITDTRFDLYYKELITPDNLTSFSSDGKKIWQTVLKLTSQTEDQSIKNYIYQNRESISQRINSSSSQEEEMFWNTFLKVKGVDSDIINVFFQENSIKGFFRENSQPTSDFFKFLAEHGRFNSNCFISNLTPELIHTFPSSEDQMFWTGVLRLKNLNYESLKLIYDPNNTDLFIDKKTGQPKINLFETLAEQGEVYSIVSNLTPEIMSTFSDKDQKEWQTALILALKIGNIDSQVYIFQNRESIFKKINSSPNPEKTLDQYLSVMELLNSSPSKEIQRMKNQLTIEIFNTPNPLESYQKISDIFTKNNLPMVAKIYQVFNVLYPLEKINQMLSIPNLSRVLVDAKSSRFRQQIILNDLLKVNLGSGEQSLVNYLNLFQTSSPILEKVKSGGDLTTTESTQLTVFFKKLDALYDVSLLSRIQPAETLDTPTLQSKVAELYQKYKVAEGQTISDRVAQMYLSGLGIKSIPEALDYINQIKTLAHQRNLARTDFSLSPGDLVKCVRSYNLDNIINFGCVAREYLGSDAGSDATPFDTDFIRSDSVYPPNMISSVGASDYGDLFLIVKDRGQLQNSSETGNVIYDSNKLEVFYNGLIDKKHYGVRTGFPSSEIDFLVVTNTDPQKLASIYFQIASHDVYIPIIDGTGKFIFTPEDYRKYKLDTESINQTLSENNFSPSKLITTIKNNPYLEKLYNLDAGVSEGYSIEKHTQMVMGQFEKYFSKNQFSTVLTREEFRLLLSLHDIGKGEAAVETGRTQTQHDYTQKIVKNIFVQSGISEKSSDIMIGLIDQDILGEYFSGKITAESASKKVNELSEKIDIPVTDLIDTLKTFYICDAGAYTSDAGGIASLDRLFNFDSNNDQATFSESIEARYKELIKGLSVS